MSERSILEAAARLRASGEPFLIATVVCVNGSSYRRPGARMLLTRDRWIAGSVSGGCLEGDVARKGWWRTDGGAPVVVTYDARARDADDDRTDDDLHAGFGLGCDGVVDVLLERATRPGKLDPLAFVDGCVRAQQRGALATVFRSSAPQAAAVGDRVALRRRERHDDDGVDRGGDVQADAIDPMLRARISVDARLVAERGRSELRRYPMGEGCVVEVLLEAIVPPPRVFIFGAGHDAVPVAQLARTLGWDVIVCAPQARTEARERFAGLADELVFGPFDQLAPRIEAADRAAAIVMSHNYEHDRRALATLLDTRARYIGMLGPRRRTDRMFAELGIADAPADERLHAPVGLALGAETPQEIALAIVAEIQAALTGGVATSLRETAGPIHAAEQMSA